jgi:hypothetical protein
MDEKIQDSVRKSMQEKSSGDLIQIWEKNDREEWSDETFKIIREILTERRIELPPQKEPFTEEEFSEAKKIKSIKTAIKVLILWGCINIFFWLISHSENWATMRRMLASMNIWLWILLYGGLIIGLMLLICGIIGLRKKHPIIILLEGWGLIIVGLWNILNPLLFLLGIRGSGYSIDFKNIFEGFGKFWIILGVMQLSWGFKSIDTYSKYCSSE